jgi:RNA polymerase sigma-70 factor (ECF subfamily)
MGGMTLVAIRDNAPDGAHDARPARVYADARLRAMLDAHFDFIWRSLRRLGLSEDRADDAAQEVFVVAARRLSSIVMGSEKSFLLRTAMRVASDVRRSASYRRDVAHADPTAGLEGGARPDDLLDQWRARALLDRVLHAMDLDLRSVFVLFEIEEMTTAEIAVLLEIPYGTVASRLRRAREQFQSKLAKLRTHQGDRP